MSSRSRIFACPNCQGSVTCRTSEQVTLTVREARLRCQNDECGCMFVAQIVAVRIVLPGLKPNPELRLPVGNWREPANDDAPPPPANDDRVAAEIVIG
ncbi:ogr/Delta-like zinc finger family protein [Sphingomonas sp. RS6]